MRRCTKHISNNDNYHCYYLHRRLASGEGIVSVGVRLSRCNAACMYVRRISFGGEGNTLYPVLSNYYYCHCSIEHETIPLLADSGFYPRDAMLARVFAIATCLSVRPSVCPSVTRRYCA